MCNLYSMTTTTEAIQRLVQEWEDAMRNIPLLHAIYPDYTAPVIKQRESDRVLGFARWGLPSLKDPTTDKPNRGNTNIRHPWFEDWKGYLGVENRCLVPVNRFAASSPKWSDSEAGVTLTIFSTEAVDVIPLNARQASAMETLRPGDSIRLPDYTADKNLSERQARRDLAELEKAGFLRRIGQARATFFQRTDKTV
jgi:hypothetical protein